MNAAGNSSFRYRFPGLAALCAIGLLAACDKPASVDASATGAQRAAEPCTIPHTKANAELSKSDEELLAASAAGDVSGARQSLEQGANVNASGALKRTPLFVAAFCDRPELVKLLLDKGSKHDVADANGMPPLHAAVIVGGAEIAKLLLANGANVDGRDAAGRSALHVAAATNQIPLVELLLAGKANAAARDKNGKTAAALAKENGHSDPGVAIRKWQEKHKAPQPK
ncbi:MAG: ankyrin repeat domain-containing protein [Sulfuritalea sp.]|nr:ankyrin repeat domain-containing protein [Sulfuritalea sp.]MDP1983688.1 ankyrin repeat domain-containing protein [Sulfuritalea sp.]